MTGRELYEHLRDDGAWGATKATLLIVGFVLTVSTLVHLRERRRTRRPRRTPEQEAFVRRLHEAARDFPTHDDEDDGLTREWGWR